MGLPTNATCEKTRGTPGRTLVLSPGKTFDLCRFSREVSGSRRVSPYCIARNKSMHLRVQTSNGRKTKKALSRLALTTRDREFANPREIATHAKPGLLELTDKQASTISFMHWVPVTLAVILGSGLWQSTSLLDPGGPLTARCIGICVSVLPIMNHQFPCLLLCCWYARPEGFVKYHRRSLVRSACWTLKTQHGLFTTGPNLSPVCLSFFSITFRLTYMC